MPVTLTTGMFPVAQLPAAQVVSVRIFLGNLENRPRQGTVEVSRMVDGNKQHLRAEEVEVPGDSVIAIELPSEDVEGRTIEVTVTVPTDGFAVGALPLVPGLAVISFFTGEATTSILQWISSDDFIQVGQPQEVPAVAGAGGLKVGNP
ncbi:MAG: hypothetical protein H0Z37_03210 [Firmicutes bacterium]|nr:hypothetical protein [Bacillota bacterium]